MGEGGAGRPAARAIVPPAEPSDSAISGAKLTAHRSEGVPTSNARPIDGDWANLATAPTLLLTPIEVADTDDSATTSRIATPPAMSVEGQPWFRSGTTVPPPSMRPMGGSLAPPRVERPPNPRILKIVAGVIAACLFIVAVAGMKLLYKRVRTPDVTRAPIEESSPPTGLATGDLTRTPPSAPENARPAELPPTAPESATLAGAGAVPTAPAAEAPRRATPVRASPARGATKSPTRRAPAPKKTGRGAH
jgi:hypothetical protein